MPEISLIISTKGRSCEIRKLLASLANQSMSDFEVLVVDQNDDDGLKSVFRGYPFPIRHIHTPDKTGVSRGRNVGLALATGTFVVFPDDDCWYPDDFLQRVLGTMKDMQLDALTGRPTDELGKPIQGRFEKQSQYINKDNVWTTQIEWLSVWRRARLVAIEGFDEDVGVGANSPWQSAEGQDLMLRLIAAGGVGWYDVTLVGHDAGVNLLSADKHLRRKARAYGRGMGFVIRKHQLGAAVAMQFLIRPLGGAILAGLRGKFALAAYYLATLTGRIEGLSRHCFNVVPV